MKLLFTFVVLLIGFFVLIRLIENTFIFFPDKQPGDYGLLGSPDFQVEDCFFLTRDGTRLHGWFVRNDTVRTTLLWCHGNAGNISDRIDNLVQLAKLPINIFIFDFRGYGKSEGTPNEAGVYLDALAAYDFLIQKKQVQSEDVVLFGRSLGGAIAVDLASKRPCAKLILESTFTAAGDMAKKMFGLIPVQLVMKSSFDSLLKIGQLQMPVLFIHGNQDSVVPYELGKKLFDAANEPKEFYTIDGADHNDTYLVGGRAYFKRIELFLQKE